MRYTSLNLHYHRGIHSYNHGDNIQVFQLTTELCRHMDRTVDLVVAVLKMSQNLGLLTRQLLIGLLPMILTVLTPMDL